MKLKVCPECGANIPIMSRSCSTCYKQFPMLTRKRKVLFFCCLLALIASGILAGTQIAYRTFLLNSYQPATCRTLDEQVFTSASNSGASINIDVTYDLTTASGEHIVGKSRLSTSDFNEAEDMKNFYQVGSTYDCWYSTFSPLHTTILRGDNPYLLPVLLFFIYVPLFSCMFFFFYTSIYQPLQFVRKGVKTQGIVVEQDKKPKRSTSLVRFQTLTDPPIEYTVLIPGRYRANRHLSLIYDPKHPAERVQMDDKANKKIQRVFITLGSIGACFFGAVLLLFALIGFFTL